MLKKYNKYFFFILLFNLLGIHSFAEQESGDRPGYFYLPPGSANVSSISEEQYKKVLIEFQNFWQLEVIQKTKKPLLVKLEWESPYFAAFAVDKTTHWEISLWGGMARAREATTAHLKAVLCHELGHIIGGEPRQTIPGSDWASTEGQSDFFAASVCLPKVLKAEDLKNGLSADVSVICQQNEKCQLIAQAGWELILFFQRFSYKENPEVSLLTPAKAAPELVRNTYPSDQCRLDSYVQGALCSTGVSCRAPVCWLPPTR